MALLGAAILAFVAFSLCSSAVYVLNDLLDLSADRNHPRKKERPLASGRVPIIHGFLIILILLVLTGTAASSFPPTLMVSLGVYIRVTLAYSLALKEIAIIDVLTLKGLYTLRILAGAAATCIRPLFWLVAFSMFLFFSSALVKCTTELN